MQLIEPERKGSGGRGRCVWGLAGVMLWAGMAWASTKGPVPEIRLPMADLGFQGVSPAYVNVGGSMLTVHFVDSEHLLFTYSLRGLVPRVANDPPTDDDRVVRAELVEVESGKILGRTEWHMHDHGRYLWALGEGRFMVRIGDALFTMAPMANLQRGEPFLRAVFPHRPGSVDAVVISGDNKLLTVETKPVVPKMDVSAVPSFVSNLAGSTQVILDLYRISGAGSAASPLTAEAVGAASSAVAVALPVDGDGYLHADDLTHGKWGVTFEPYGSKPMPVASVDSSCAPMLKRVGPGLLVAMACRGITGKVMMSAYDFAKTEIWEESLAQTPVPPTFVLSPETGRFAMSRINSPFPDLTPGTAPDDTVSQEVRVYQTQTGDLLLKLNCSPILRTAENFDLAADGMRVVVIRGDALEVYRLPELSKTDKLDLATIRKLAPTSGSAGKIDLRRLLVGDVADTPAGAAAVDEQATQASPAAVAGEGPANGDSQKPRTAPTLLKPGEKPDFGKGNEPQ